jgi:hypothetical protein
MLRQCLISDPGKTFGHGTSHANAIAGDSFTVLLPLAQSTDKKKNGRYSEMFRCKTRGLEPLLLDPH